ncbi:hypothetical protein BXO88_14590 [Oribacterium sp. C9]|nr:hypothetical protein BXO88_14590 [Oribacterium sp. C9]
MYISEFDIIGAGHTIYHVNKVIAETGQIIEDGTDISSLMSCFTKKEFNNPKFPRLSKEVKYLKTTEGGLNSMCTVMKYYEDIAEQRGRSEGLAEGLAEGRSVGISEGKRLSYFEMVQDGDMSVKKAAQKTNLTEEEFLKEMKLSGFNLPQEQTI